MPSDDALPHARNHGLCVWLTGLSGAGKTTIATLLYSQYKSRGTPCRLLDGDELRASLSPKLGFSRAERHEHILRVAALASDVVRGGGVAICALVSPYEDARQAAAALIGRERFLLVYVDSPVEVCERRDPKGLYAKARRGEIAHFTGIDDPYEPPASPDLHLRTDRDSPDVCVAEIARALELRGVFAPLEVTEPR